MLKPEIFKFRRSKKDSNSSEFRWRGVKVRKYKDEEGTWSKICRQVITGKRGERTKFHLRYFEIAPGGYSSLEKHRHEHVVICVNGEGKAIAGNKVYRMKFLDVLYISPNTPHQFINESDKPFGFFCIVDSKRDKPRPVSKSELKELLKNRHIRRIIRLPGALT